MIERIAFTLYPVKDVARARAFYEGTLGLAVSSDFGGRWIEFELSGGVFAISDMIPDLGPSAERGGKIAFEVDDVDALTERLRASGVPVVVEPFSTPVCRMSVVLDPEGNSLTLHHVTA
ncbi:MAG: VOC family protein [Candidatus Polarisedimenticolia bacterium]